MDAKKRQRSEAKKAVESISESRRAKFSRTICDHLLASPAFAKSRIIASFQPLPSEVNITRFNREASKLNKLICYSICAADGTMLMALPDGARYKRDQFGIRIPAKYHAIPPENIDLVIVPCVAYDPDTHHRLGRGAGYYDRYLPKCVHATTTAVAFTAQAIKKLAHEPHDIPTDSVITENGTI